MRLLQFSPLITKVLLGGMDRDEDLPISVRLAMCAAETERDPFGPRGDGSAAGSSTSASSSDAGTGGATSTSSPLLFPGLSGKINSSSHAACGGYFFGIFFNAVIISNRMIQESDPVYQNICFTSRGIAFKLNGCASSTSQA